MTPLQQSPQAGQSCATAAASEFIEPLNSPVAYGQSRCPAIPPHFGHIFALPAGSFACKLLMHFTKGQLNERTT
jgi:hypothetical protein